MLQSNHTDDHITYIEMPGITKTYILTKTTIKKLKMRMLFFLLEVPLAKINYGTKY